MGGRERRFQINNNLINGPGFVESSPPEEQFASFLIRKIDVTTGLPLAGVTFTLFQGNTEIAIEVTNENGEVRFSDLSPGEYQLEETIGLPGYQETTNLVTITIQSAVEIYMNGVLTNELTLENVPVFQLAFLKVDNETRQPLSRATYTLTDALGTVRTVTSNADGLVDFGVVPPGRYVLVEISSPPGYVDNNVPLEVIVTNDGTITVGQVELSEFVATNERARFEFFVRKLSIDGTRLSDALFELINDLGEVRDVQVSDFDGVARFSNVLPGQYVIREAIPPAGFAPIQTDFPVIVKEDGEIIINNVPGDGYPILNEPLQ